MNDKPAFEIEVGQTWLFFAPPSWLMAGTVIQVNDDEIQIGDDGVYIENVNSGYAVNSAVPSATTAKELTAAIQKAWATPNFVIRREFIGLRWPCKRDMTPLARMNDAETIKKA